MTDSNTDPCDETCHAADVDEPVICFAFTDKGGKESGQAEYGRGEEGVRRHAALIEFEKEFRRLPCFCHGIEHACRNIEA